MIDFLRRCHSTSPLGRFLLEWPRSLYHVYRGHMLSEEAFIKHQFKKVFGHVPDLHNPKTLNEKIQWLKLHDRSPLHTRCVDKYAVRAYVAKNVGDAFLVPLLLHTDDPADVTPENLSDPPFIVKTTHGSFGGAMVRNLSEVDWKALRKSLRKALQTNYYYLSKEWPYKDVPPRIVVERLLLDQDGNIPFDYKVHCFNGRPTIIQVDLDRFTSHKRNLYDTQWNLQPFTWCVWANGEPLWPNGRPVAAPSQLGQMLHIAEVLSAPFYYARIDLYEVDGRVFFGEITFHHGSGTEIFAPPEWDRRLGDMLTLPPEGRDAHSSGGRNP